MTLSDVTVRRRMLLLGVFTNLLLLGAVALGAYASWRISNRFDDSTHRLERIVAAAESAGAAGQDAGGATRQLTSLLRIAATEIQRDADAAEEERLRSLLYLGAVTALTLIASLVVGLATARSIVRPLEGVVGLARSVAAGDLTTRVKNGRHDELGDVLRSLSEMNTSLSEVVTRVQEGAQAVKGAATEIASGTDDLSARTEAQAASLQQTAASIEQMTAAVERNAQAARRANTLAAEAAQVALGAGDMVGRMVERMDDIQRRSRRIAEIVGLIDSIAFQTNILALNAAVEAARAGESGRGFAVVATEVRNLASRSAEAARQIKDLIGGAVAAVNTGATIADDAGRAMVAVTTSVKDVSGIIGEISNATSEQQAGIGQINQAITELDRVTQRNAAMAQQSQRGSRALERMAERLEHSVGFFKVKGGAPRAAPLVLIPAGD